MSIALKNGISRILFMSISVSHSMWGHSMVDCQMTTHGSSAGKESTYNAGDSKSGRSTGEGIGYLLQCSWASLVAQRVKNLPAMQETWVQSLKKISWRREWLPNSSILAWRIPWTAGPGGLQSMVSQTVRQWLSAFHFHFHSKQPLYLHSGLSVMLIILMN